MKKFTLLYVTASFFYIVNSQPVLQWSYSHYHYQMQWSNAVKVMVDKTNTPLVLDMVWGWEATPMMNLYKLNQNNGNFIWQRGGVGSSEGRKLYIDSLNNIYVAGSNKLGFYGIFPFMMKCTPSGSLVFYKVDSTQPFPQFSSACIDNSGNSYLLSYYQRRFKIIKYDASGNVNWNSLYSNHDSINLPKAIGIDKNNFIWLAGYSFRSNNIYLTVLKQSPVNGFFIDTLEFILPPGTSTYNSTFSDIKFDDSSNVYINFRYSVSSAERNALYKLNPSISPVWIRIDSLLSSDPEPAFKLLDNGAILKNKATGITEISPAGNTLWSYNTGFINDMTTDPEGYIYLAGTTSYSGSSSYYTCKLNSNGSFIWSVNFVYSNMSENTALSIALDTNHNIFVHGESASSPADAVSTIKYNQFTGINSISSNIPEKINLYQNYPNPFNPETIIRFDINYKQNIKLIIFDITGKELFKFDHSSISPGTYEYVWDAHNFSSGVYFAKLIGDNYTETKRMILIK
jgi:hypothetical protein